ncbi:MAG: hypothetical protein AAFR59_05255 [Bacteroidota bacterium]
MKRVYPCHDIRTLCCLLFLLTGMRIALQSQTQLIFTDSVRVPEGILILEKNESRELIFDTQEQLIINQQGGVRDTVALSKDRIYRNIRAGCVYKDRVFLLNYPFYIVEVDLKKQRVRRLRLRTKWEGKFYDIFTRSFQSMAYLPEDQALIFYVLPLRNEQENMFSSVSFYKDNPLLGVFSLRGKNAKLTRCVGIRDSIYWAEGGILAHMHHTCFFADLSQDRFFTAQIVCPTIVEYGFGGEKGRTFGQAGQHIERDSLIPIKVDQFSRRKADIFQRAATLYLDIHVDTQQKLLYRKYRIGEIVSIEDSLLNEPDPPPIKGVCPFDPYTRSLLRSYPPEYGLQVYDLNPALPQPRLLYDMKMTQRFEILDLHGEGLYLSVDKKDGTKWLYQASIPLDR